MAEESESSSMSLKHVSLLNRGLSNQDKLKSYCQLHYQMRRVKNKGAILVLILSYLVISTFCLLIEYVNENLIYQTWLLTFGITTTLAGWLADAFIGRYKVIHFSLWMTWLTMVIATVSSVIAQLDDRYYQSELKILTVIFSLVGVGLGGFQANIIQFGLDQLHDASTTEITSFIIWYVCTLFSASFIVHFNFTCLNEQYKLFMLLFICINLTLAMLLLFCCNHWLVKEPVTQNPFKLVYKVIKYAINTKYPRCRSAFTYCEDDLPTRIDFGKSKYGGPFTTEQVEDVKTFLRLLYLNIGGGILAGVVIAANLLQIYLSQQYTNLNQSTLDSKHTYKKFLLECYSKTSLTNSIYFIATILIVVHEVFIYPVLYRCCLQIKSLYIWKLTIGMVLHILHVITLMLFDVSSRYIFLKNNGYNVTIIQCIFYEKHGILSTSFTNHWMAIPNFLQSLSWILFLTGTIEFTAAQVPYSMKGLMIGVFYGSTLLFAVIELTLFLTLFTRKLSIWGTGIISCGFWYALSAICIDLTVCVALLLLMRWYKKRKREDVLPNEHFFAERYYSQDTSYLHDTFSY